MASSSREKNEGFLFKQDRPHFFRVVLEDSMLQHKLAIPRKFVKIYGDILSSPVMLKVPTGAKWPVEIVRSDGEIWLQSGWAEFAEYYSVVVGNFLVFEYEKSNREFNVIIFDKSTTEIDYPLTSFSNGDSPERANLDQEQVHQDPIKKKIKLEETSANTLDQYSPTTGRQRINRTAMKKKALINEEKTNAVRKVTFNLQSKNPSFRIVMQPSFVSKRGVLVIPPSFARKYLNKNGDAALKVLDGRTWSVNYYSKKRLGITKTRIVHFGWNKFVQDNHLDVGDVCVFELIDHAQTTFKVAVSKYSEAANLCTLFGNIKESIDKGSRRKERKLSFSNRREAKEAAKKITLANPSFQAKISSGRLKSCAVYVPTSFMKNVKQETKYARLKVNNRCWLVKLIIHPGFCGGQLSSGWAAFARDNSLKVGDVCTFQLIRSTDQTPLIYVSIIRDSGICLGTNGVDRETEPPVSITEIPDQFLGHQVSSPRKRKEKSRLSSSQPHKKMKTHHTCNLQPENPAFQIAITPSHVHRTWGVSDIPAGFARKYMKRTDGHAVLNVLDGKTWSVKYYRRLFHGAIRTKIMHSDWIKFARGNHLQVGDTCTFKLIDPHKSTFGVTISKRRKATNLGQIIKSNDMDSGKSKLSMRKRSGAIECLSLGKPSFSNPPEASKKFTSVSPFFQVAMTSSHLKGRGNVNVPRRFINYLEHGTRIAQLQVDNRLWSVKLVIYPHYSKCIFSGWVSFARGNSLKVGDVCSFELIDTQNLVIKVSISRDSHSKLFCT